MIASARPMLRCSNDRSLSMTAKVGNSAWMSASSARYRSSGSTVARLVARLRDVHRHVRVAVGVGERVGDGRRDGAAAVGGLLVHSEDAARGADVHELVDQR